MRFLHTADWHLGRVLHGVSLLEDQRHVIEQIIGIARQEKPDFLVVAGDVYDRAVPPVEAVQLLSETLERLAFDLGLPTLVIAGNHDCPHRLGFGARLLEQAGVKILGDKHLGRCAEAHTVQTASGECVDLYFLPYAEPAVMRFHLQDSAVRCHDSAMRAATARIHSQRRSDRRNVLVGHAYVDGGEACESERPLSVGGAGMVSAAHFAGFDYVALGHLHRPQSVGSVARYAGSPLKYSFSESGDRKSVTMVELPAFGTDVACSWHIPLSPRRELSAISGRFDELCAQAAESPVREHYLSVELLDEVMILDAKGRLEACYPHILHLDRRALRLAAGMDSGTPDAPDLRRVGPETVFSAFYRDVKGCELTSEQATAFGEILATLPADEQGGLT